MLRTRRSLALAASLALTAATAVSAAVTGAAPPKRPGPAGKGATLLMNGWKISPAGTRHETLGDLLESATVSPDGKWLAFVNGGAAAHAVHVRDAHTGAVVASLPVDRAQSSGGIAWAPDSSRLFVSGSNAGRVYVFDVAGDGKLTAAAPLVIPNLKTDIKEAPRPDPGKDAGRDPMLQAAPAGRAFLSGLALSRDGRTVYVANLEGETVYALDSATGRLKNVRKLTAFDRPGVVRVAPDGKAVYVALWGRTEVLVLDPETLETRATLTVGRHPNDLLFTKDGSRLFVSCGNDDTVHVIDTAAGRTLERIAMRLTPLAPPGATPSALALSPDEKTLYVANSDNNDVAVVDVGTPVHSRIEGFIPTTWYPTTVAVSPDGKQLFIGCGKGMGTGPNADTKKIDPVAPKGYPYIMTQLKGVLSTVAIPDAKQLAAYTKQVYANSPYNDGLLDKPYEAPKPGTNPVPSKIGDPSPIKHVLYIIKENRTYDQVFGDMTDAKGKHIGNGDPNLTLFGEEVSPNHHELAREFVLLDNMYCNGEVSADGHHWSNGAYVPDFMQRTIAAQYGGKGDPPVRYGDFGDPLADTPSGRIWDLCAKANLSFRTYYYHTDKNQNVQWAEARQAGVRDYKSVEIYTDEVKKWDASAGEDMPRFMVMALSEDHTKGTRPGVNTPKACVASNDVGIGKIVDAISHSRFWKDTAIFIIEDDAQNGPDHVDAHRTVALVVSPYTRRGAVDSTMYSTCSLLRTMELILGVPPMSQYDAAATPLYASFTMKPDFTPYTARPARIDLEAKNTATAYGAKQSLALDLSAPDHLTRQDEDTLNRVLWHAVKGANVPYPGIVKRPLFDLYGRPVTTPPGRKADDDDDDE